MTLLFVDGCDHWTTEANGGLTKWTAYSGPGLGTDPAWARTGTRGLRTSGSGGPPANVRKQLLVSQEHATLIFGAAFKWLEPMSSQQGLMILRSDNNATTHITLAADMAGKLKVYRGPQATGTLLASESGASLATINTFHYLEIKATLHDTTGTVEVRVDGRATPVISFSGDTKNAGTKTGFDTFALDESTGAVQKAWDDIYVCNGAGTVNNDFLGDVRIDTLFPISDGANNGLSLSTGSSHFALVDEVPANTTDYVFQNTDGTKDTWGYADTATVGIVKGVQVNTWTQKSDAGAKAFRPVVRHSGVDYAGVDVALGVGFAGYQQVYETNPGTSAAWSTAEVNAAEFGAEVRP